MRNRIVLSILTVGISVLGITTLFVDVEIVKSIIVPAVLFLMTFSLAGIFTKSNFELAMCVVLGILIVAYLVYQFLNGRSDGLIWPGVSSVVLFIAEAIRCMLIREKNRIGELILFS